MHKTFFTEKRVLKPLSRARSDPFTIRVHMGATAIVIGGGVGGLSAAIHLAARGVRVTLLEKNDRVGGKLNRWLAAHPQRPHDRPFTFDTGPSLLTLPLVFQDLFAAAGEDVRQYLPIQRLDPIARYVWSDGTRLDLPADDQARLQAITQLWPEDAAGFARLLRRGESIWDLSADAFLFHAPEQLFRGIPSPGTALGLLTMPLRIGMFGNFARLIDRHIRSHKLRQLLYQYATYSGASPFRAPATFAVIPFVEMCFGAWYIPGGMYQLAAALEQVARKLGIEIHTNCEAAEILVEESTRRRVRTTGIRTTTGQTLNADVIVANSDLIYTYRQLIDPRVRQHYNDERLEKFEPGGSGFVLLLGIEGTYPQLAHHTKFMPDDYTSDLRAMFQTRTIPDDPCIYVCASTRTDSTQAPSGCENLFVLASAPALNGRINWATEGIRYRNQLVTTLESRWGLTDLSKRIVVERMITPDDLERLYHANAGSIYGIGSNSRRAAFLRPRNRDRKIAGLYFAGGATHPGGGLPLVALSGKIAAELVTEDLGLDRSSR